MFIFISKSYQQDEFRFLLYLRNRWYIFFPRRSQFDLFEIKWTRTSIDVIDHNRRSQYEDINNFFFMLIKKTYLIECLILPSMKHSRSRRRKCYSVIVNDLSVFIRTRNSFLFDCRVYTYLSSRHRQK